MTTLVLWVRHLVERLLVRGSWAFLILLVVLQGVLATSGALLAFLLPGRPFGTYGEALWWATLRISDPGYLSDDLPSLQIRVLSVVLSVVGMAITVGGIVAIVTQSMNALLARLAQATTPVPFSGHVVLIGWTDRTPRLLVNLVRRHRCRVVVLVDGVRQELHGTLAALFPKTSEVERVTFRAGQARRHRDLELAGCHRAQAVILSASGEAVAGDPEAGPRALQALVALRRLLDLRQVDRREPRVIMELVDRGLIPVAESTLPGVLILHSDRVVARVLRLGIQAPGLLRLAASAILPDRGWRVEQLVDESVSDVGVDSGVSARRVLGVLRNTEGPQRLDTRASAIECPGEALLTLSQLPPFPEGRRRVDEAVLDELLVPRMKRILLLGWNEVVPDLLAELALEPVGRYSVDVVSTVLPDVRERVTAGVTHDRYPLHHLEGDPLRLGAEVEAQLGSYHRIVVMADRTCSPETATVRSLAVVLGLLRARQELHSDAGVIAELTEAGQVEVMPELETVVTPHLAVDVLTSLVFVPDGKRALSETVSHQVVFVTRVIDAKQRLDWDSAELDELLRARGLALIHVLEREGKPTRFLVAEPTDLGET